jgi:hypothetical protein
VFRGDQPLQVERRLYQMEDYIQQLLAFDVRQGTIARHPGQGWSLLCNGVIVFDDTGQLAAAGHGPGRRTVHVPPPGRAFRLSSEGQARAWTTVPGHALPPVRQ